MPVSQGDIELVQGDDYSALVTVLNSDGTAPDLTGYAAQAQIRIMAATPQWPYVVAEIDCAVSPPNFVELAIGRDQSVRLHANYVWDLELVAPDGTVTTILQGRVLTTQHVTDIPAEPASWTLARTADGHTVLQVLQMAAARIQRLETELRRRRR